MPTLKKRSGKTTITLYASEERQIQGAIETLKFIEVNTDSHVSSNAGMLSSGLGAILHYLKPKPAETQGELIPDDKKGAAK